MADTLLSYKQMSSKWNSSVPWNKDTNYVIRCLEANFGPSKAGNPMITFKYEVVAPETMEVAGEQYTIAGTQLTTWQVAQTMEDGVVNVEKTQKNKDALVKLFNAFGLPSDNINPENVDTSGFVNKCVYALLYNDQREQRKSPTAAQLAAGQREGDVLVNPVTKQPLKTNFPKIGEIFGLAPTGTGFGY